MSMPHIPHGYDEVEAVYGKFSYRDTPEVEKGSIAIDAQWALRNIVTLPLVEVHPSLAHLSRALRIHIHLKDEIKLAMAAAVAAAPNYVIDSMVSFVPRHKLHNPSKPLSLHSWGIAVDINPSRNAYGRPGDLPLAFVEAFEARGWNWGGRWAAPHQDWMHFQAAAGC